MYRPIFLRGWHEPSKIYIPDFNLNNDEHRKSLTHRSKRQRSVSSEVKQV